MSKVICFVIKLYQLLIRPIIKPSCRYIPSCSEYSVEAFEQHGFFRGIWLTCTRLLRCHPWAKSGFDPVLPNKEK